METLKHFIERTKGTAVDFPNTDHDTNLKGQCVTLVQNYIYSCLGQPYTARGNAVDWIQTYVNEGLGYTVSDQKTGDIIVFPNEASGYGHIGIWVDGKIYDQNNLRHDNGLAGFGEIFSWDFVTLRPNANLIIDEPNEEPKPTNKKSDYEVALDVIEGYYGNGNDRVVNLTNAGYDYDTIQAIVNEILGQ